MVASKRNKPIASQPQTATAAVTINYIDEIVKLCLVDGIGTAYTDAEKASAQQRLGVGGAVVTIPAATSEYTLSEGIFKHAPTNAPTYNLTSITDTIRSHVIVLAIDFSSVQTFSFVPPQDSGVTFQSYANPNLGDVWVFRCVWYGGEWRIAPTKIKNCLTRQLTSGALAITDAVAGDALALKMTAPRSVVMNQLAPPRVPTNRHGLQFSINGDGSVRIHGTCDANGSYGTAGPVPVIKGCKYAFCMYGAEDYTNGCLMYGNAKANGYSAIFTAYADTNLGMSIAIYSGDTVDLTVYTMAVDLTQYFNGDSTLIDSIQSWDDLVAYDPRFASYVEYNTGEVKGVVPAVSVNNGTAIASPSELFAVGNAADEYEAVAGTLAQTLKQVDLSTLTWTAGDGTYSATITDIKPSTLNFLLPNGYVGSVSGTTLTITASATPTGTMVYEKATKSTTDVTPVQIDLQSGNNVTMQTDGGRLADIDVTYESNEI
jgi:hypothetical protein